ncbi:MAG: ABC transporter substrate-binding protein [Lentisphaeria bacterium]|nr:ABC transporter substrate-binding protein [Lentisphaeria bacterium]
MRKTGLFVLFLLSMLLVSCRIPNQNEAFHQIRIGVILPLSGNERVQGKAALDGMELAVRECNIRGGIDKRKVQLCIYNSSGNPGKAAQIAREAIEKDNIVAIIGAYSSNEAVQIKLVAEELGVPYVANMATHESLTKDAKYTFQSTLSDEIQGAALAYYIAFKRRFLKPAVMINTDPALIYPRDLGRKTAQAWADFSGREPLLMTYSAGQKSFAQQIQKCIYEDVDVIVLPSYPECAKRFILEARKLNYKGAFAGSDSYEHPLLLNAAEELGDCFFSTPYYVRNKSEENQEFVALMQKNYKRLPSAAEAMGYDGINFLLKGLRNAYTPDEIAANLDKMRSFYSVSGTVEYHSIMDSMLHPVFIMAAPGKKIPPVLQWTVDSTQLKNYRKREEN